ncbi:MAG: hypothetical protein F4X03_03030 [Dehalococcoidia bacterium]|nr:hypothetical protein [Chloroflexota bacterium]MXX17929.1 hypothetical protein [Dehalococcoidia bacterium]MYD27878.1 hypothetical protein [Dehalococcoidia bacterium]
MARSLPALVIVALLGLFALACDDGPPPDPVADEEYLAVMCVNLDRFSDAVMEATAEAEIAEVIEGFIEELEAVEPPADLRDFHEAFIEYLEEAVDDPTSPLVLAPPLPDDDVRERLADKERSVEECREPTFFNGPQADQ